MVAVLQFKCLQVLLTFCCLLYVHCGGLLISEPNQRPISILIITNSLPGHLTAPTVLGEELVRRGHNVTLCTVPMEGANSAQKLAKDTGMGFKSAPEGYLAYLEFQRSFIAVALGNATAMDHWNEYSIHVGMSAKMGEFLDRKNITEYDLIIATVRLAKVTACLSKKWEIPAIILGVTQQFQSHLLPEWPFPPFYTKRGRIKTSDDLSFNERLHTFLFNARNAFLDRFYKSRYEFVCSDPSVDYSYMSTFTGIWAPHIIPTAIGFEYPRTTSPLTHYVGAMLSKQRKVLPTELQEWLDFKPPGSVIMISMGSLAHLTREQGRIIVSAVSKTNYSAVWSLREQNRDILEGIELDSDKFLLSTWLPQVAVLNHSAVGVAILHGGMNGVHEAIAYGVPIIVIPFWTDQGDISARVHHSGVGIQILRQHLSVDSLSSAIEHIQQGGVAADLARLQRVFERAGGVDTAADLVEYYWEVGYSHLIPSFARYHWTWIQYYNADVKAVLLLAALLTLLAIYKVFYCFLRNMKMKEKKA